MNIKTCSPYYDLKYHEIKRIKSIIGKKLLWEIEGLKTTEGGVYRNINDIRKTIKDVLGVK